jgi:hypothetical protein
VCGGGASASVEEEGLLEDINDDVEGGSMIITEEEKEGEGEEEEEEEDGIRAGVRLLAEGADIDVDVGARALFV